MNPYQTQGLAGEYTVAADLSKQGALVHFAASGCRYDLIADVDGRLVRIQVKSTAKQIYDYGHKNPTYKFNLAKNRRSKFITATEVDVVALVALDTGYIAYLPAPKCAGRTIKIRPAGAKNNYWSKRSNAIDQLPFAKALAEVAA